MSGPFDPPAETGDAVGRIGGVLFAWALSGAVLGTAVGFTLHATRSLVGAAAPFGIGGVLVAVGLGATAVRMDRARVARLAPLPGQRATDWPIHGAVVAVPLVATMPAALWLGLVAAVGLRTLAPVVVAGVAVVGVGWSLLRVWSDHRLVVALQALSADQPDVARMALATLAEHPLATARARRAARENLGALLLSDGELSAAAHWYAQVPDSARAAAGLAVAQAALGQGDAALATVERGRRCPDARRASSELDAARVFAVWRSEGEEVARKLVRNLDGPGAGGLFAALRDHLGGQPVEEGTLLATILSATRGR